MATRSIPAEKNALKLYGQKYGKMPSTPQDWAEVHKLAYPTTDTLPDEFRDALNYSKYEPSGNPQLGQLYGEQEVAQNQMEGLSSPNTALRVLQDAIRAKTGQAQTQMGQSSIFQQSGVGGMGALQASLTARSEEMKINQAEFSNIIGQMAGTYSDMANAALNKYKIASEAYEKEKTRLDGIEAEAKKYEQQVQLLKLQHDLNKELQFIGGTEYQGAGYFDKETGAFTPVNTTNVMRTDRHNNPIAVSDAKPEWIQMLQQAGIAVEVGDAFPGNTSLHTLKFPDAETGLKASKILLGNSDAFYWYKNNTGKEELVNVSTPEQFKALSDEEQTKIVEGIYENEGGDGRLFGDATSTLSPIEKLFYEGKYVPKTPSEYDKMANAIASKGLTLPADQIPNAVIKGLDNVYEALTKVDKRYRGQIEGRLAEWTKAEERDNNVQNYKTAASMVGMMLAKLVENNRLSDKDREFYLAQMPNLRQNSDEIAKTATDQLKGVLGARYNINIEAMNSITLRDKRTGETKEFINIPQEDLEEALEGGYEVVN